MDCLFDSSDEVRANIEFIILSITGNLKKRTILKDELSESVWEALYLLRTEGAVEIGTFKGRPAMRVSRNYLDNFLKSRGIENPWYSV